MASYVLVESQATPETIVGVSDQLHRRIQRDRIPTQSVADCVAVAMRIAIDLERPVIDFRGLVVDGASLGRVPMDELRIVGIEFRNCTVGEIAFGDPGNYGDVVFSNCLVAKVSGVASAAGLPTMVVTADCEVEAFDNMGTNSAVLQLDIDPRLKALLTILRKLYKQAGAGRKLGAFNRGITRPEVLRYIEPTLEILERHHFISIFNSVVHPVRKQASRVERILSSPTLADDELVLEVRALH